MLLVQGRVRKRFTRRKKMVSRGNKEVVHHRGGGKKEVGLFNVEKKGTHSLKQRKGARGKIEKKTLKLLVLKMRGKTKEEGQKEKG